MKRSLKNKMMIVLNEIQKYHKYEPKVIKEFLESIHNISDDVIEEKIEIFYKNNMIHKGIFYLRSMIQNAEKNRQHQLEIERKIYGDHSKIKVKINGKWKVKND